MYPPDIAKTDPVGEAAGHYSLTSLVLAAHGLRKINCPVCGSELTVFRDDVTVHPAAALIAITAVCDCRLWREEKALTFGQEREILIRGVR